MTLSICLMEKSHKNTKYPNQYIDYSFSGTAIPEDVLLLFIDITKRFITGSLTKQKFEPKTCSSLSVFYKTERASRFEEPAFSRVCRSHFGIKNSSDIYDTTSS